MKRLGNERGFTLIEIVITLVLLSILGAFGFGFMAQTSQMYTLTSVEGKLQNELWVAIERIGREAAISNSQTVDSPTQLTITVPSKSTCTNCVDKSTTIVYRLNGTNLERNGDLHGGTYYTLAEGIVQGPPGTAIFSQTGIIVRIQLTKTNGSYSLTLNTKIRPNSKLVEDIQ